MIHNGVPEWVMIFVIVLLLFGSGRVCKIVGEIGIGICNFRVSIRKEEEYAKLIE